MLARRFHPTLFFRVNVKNNAVPMNRYQMLAATDHAVDVTSSVRLVSLPCPMSNGRGGIWTLWRR